MPRHTKEERKMTEASGDFVRVATCATPTEAHVLRGVLESNGLNPFIADENLVQMNSWLTQAVGGVRVLVPTSQASEAARAIAEFSAGTYALTEDEDALTVVHAAQPAAVFNPDRAALLSFFLTPAFPIVIQIINARHLGLAARHTSYWIWLLLLGAASATSMVMVHTLNTGPFVLFRASAILWPLTVSWYFFAGQNQSRMLLSNYGPRYKKRSLLPPALCTAAALLVFGWALSEFY
jgi:hypothetical protein